MNRLDKALYKINKLMISVDRANRINSDIPDESRTRRSLNFSDLYTHKRITLRKYGI